MSFLVTHRTKKIITGEIFKYFELNDNEYTHQNLCFWLRKEDRCAINNNESFFTNKLENEKQVSRRKDIIKLKAEIM